MWPKQNATSTKYTLKNNSFIKEIECHLIIKLELIIDLKKMFPQYMNYYLRRQTTKTNS